MEHSYQHRFEHFLATIAEWHKAHRDVSPGTTVKLRKKFEKYQYDYYKAIADYRQTKRPGSLQKALDIVEQAEKEFKIYKRLELLGALSK